MRKKKSLLRRILDMLYFFESLVADSFTSSRTASRRIRVGNRVLCMSLPDLRSLGKSRIYPSFSNPFGEGFVFGRSPLLLVRIDNFGCFKKLLDGSFEKNTLSYV